jgi:hypothetical protein
VKTGTTVVVLAPRQGDSPSNPQLVANVFGVD